MDELLDDVRYAWLNLSVAVALGERLPDAVRYRVFEVTWARGAGEPAAAAGSRHFRASRLVVPRRSQ